MRSEWRGGRQLGRRCLARPMRGGTYRRIGAIRSICWRSRRRRGCRSWCRSGTGGCSCRRSRSTAARRYLMASDLAGTPRTGLHDAAVRRCPPVELRRLRGAGPAAGVQHQRLRRDAAGPVRVGREAAGRELRGRRSRPRLRRQAARDGQPRGRRGPTGRRSPAFAAMAQPRPLVHARRRRRARWPQIAASGDGEGAQARREANIAKTRAKDSLKAFAKLTDDRRRRAADRRRPAGRSSPIEELAGRRPRSRARGRSCAACIRSYRRTLSGDRRRLLERFRYVDAARKVVGVGSVGTRACIMLLLGRDDDDPLFLQFKEAEASVLEPFLGKSEFANHGQRVVEGQRLTQAASDIMLGWITHRGRRRRQARLLRPPALGREGLGAGRADGARR